MSSSARISAVESHRPGLSILIRVRGALPSLRPAELRVADAVLADPARISESSITAVARQCQTSETTVLRFCRAIGLAGYPELRIALARAAQGEESDHHQHGAPLSNVITAGDSLADVVAKITHADARAIEDTGAALDLTMLEAAVDAVASARRVDIYGLGASALVGHDLHQRLHRLGLVSFMWWERHLALTSAAVLQAGDAAIAISHSGTSQDMVDALKQAGRGGATTIAVTNFGQSPLGQAADVVLTTAARETTFRSGSMSSRIVQIALIDYLYAGVAVRTFTQGLDPIESADADRPTRPGIIRST